jgi:hypothetical protein
MHLCGRADWIATRARAGAARRALPLQHALQLSTLPFSAKCTVVGPTEPHHAQHETLPSVVGAGPGNIIMQDAS